MFNSSTVIERFWSAGEASVSIIYTHIIFLIFIYQVDCFFEQRVGFLRNKNNRMTADSWRVALFDS